jgi:tRNA-Thr(GGU) m(6)t(6)A37 methyltransferase TsaA
MSGEPEYVLRPIGRVRNQVKEWVDVAWEELESEVALDPRWAEGLDGLEEFSHIWVICWLDRLTEEERGGRCRVHPERRQELRPVGLFATRSPRRPNPIAITAVRLLGIEGTVLRVKGLDMLDGTPVLDVKPYLAQGDRIAGTWSPLWIRRLWRNRQRQNHRRQLRDRAGEGDGRAQGN